MFSKKSLVLSSVDKSERKGVLSLAYDGKQIDGQLRLYGFAAEPRGIISLGISSDNDVVKAGLTKKSSMLYTFSAQSENLNEQFSCAVVNFVEGEKVPLLFGACDSINLQTQLQQVMTALNSAQSVQDVEDVLDEYGVDYQEDEKQQIEQEIDKEMNSKCSDCANCVYKKYFFQTADIQTATEMQPQKTDTSQEEKPHKQFVFYDEIKNQVESLFNENSPEEFLQSVIPDSKWVKVELDSGGDYYVFGLIYEEDELKYVCYGVPSVYTSTPPTQLSGFPVWFPVDRDNNEGFGYWLTYQDASTGESIKVTID